MSTRISNNLNKMRSIILSDGTVQQLDEQPKAETKEDKKARLLKELKELE